MVAVDTVIGESVAAVDDSEFGVVGSVGSVEAVCGGVGKGLDEALV